jgi:hypothetical protein
MRIDTFKFPYDKINHEFMKTQRHSKTILHHLH